MAFWAVRHAGQTLCHFEGPPEAVAFAHRFVERHASTHPDRLRVMVRFPKGWRETLAAG
jgi:hypothetical protein